MYGLSIELLEYISEKLNIGDAKPNYLVTVRRKLGDGSFEEFETKLTNVISIDIDRRYNMSCDECKITLFNKNGEFSPDYSHNKEFENVKLEPSGYSKLISPFNELKVKLGYNDQLVTMFTGQIINMDINEKSPTISFNAKSNFRKLLKPIDPIKKRSLIYENQPAFEIIKDLLSKAGIDEILVNVDEINEKDFAIEKAVFELGTQYSDAIKTILDTMDHRITASREGGIKVLKRELYNQQSFHNWEFSDYVNLTRGSYKIDSSIFRNRVIVKSQSTWNAFEDKFLLSYCNNELISSAIEVPWANTIEQKHAVADAYFLDMRRKLRRIVVGVKGNPSMDIGDLVKMEALISTANGKYMISGIKTTMNESGYVDIVDLEFVADSEGHICEIAEGDYLVEVDEDGNSTQGGSPLKSLVLNRRDEIINKAISFLGTYYQWGGNFLENSDDYGLDCSHFTYIVFKAFDLMDEYMVAKDQKEYCQEIDREDLSKGDLVFYTNSNKIVNHVGIYMGNNKVISASGGGSNTKTKGKAIQQNAKIKVHDLDYRKNKKYYGRIPNIDDKEENEENKEENNENELNKTD